MFPFIIRVFWKSGRTRHGLQRRLWLRERPSDALVDNFFVFGNPLHRWRLLGEGRFILQANCPDGKAISEEMIDMAANLATIASGGGLAYAPRKCMDVRMNRPVTYWTHRPTGAPFLTFGLRPGEDPAEALPDQGFEAVPLDFTKTSFGYTMTLVGHAGATPSVHDVVEGMSSIRAVWDDIDGGRTVPVRNVTANPLAGMRDPEAAVTNRAPPPERKPSAPPKPRTAAPRRHVVARKTPEARETAGRKARTAAGRPVRSVGPEHPASGIEVFQPDPDWYAGFPIDMRARAESIHRKALVAKGTGRSAHLRPLLRTQLKWAFHLGLDDGGATDPLSRELVSAIAAWADHRAAIFVRATHHIRRKGDLRDLDARVLREMGLARDAGLASAARDGEAIIALLRAEVAAGR